MNPDEYTNYCLNSIFKNLMFFKESKRLKKKADKAKLRDFKRDIFDESIPVATTVAKYFKFTARTETENNIAYKNATCKSVSKWTRSRLNKKGEYQVGEMLVCRTYFKLLKKGSEVLADQKTVQKRYPRDWVLVYAESPPRIQILPPLTAGHS